MATDYTCLNIIKYTYPLHSVHIGWHSMYEGLQDVWQWTYFEQLTDNCSITHKVTVLSVIHISITKLYLLIHQYHHLTPIRWRTYNTEYIMYITPPFMCLNICRKQLYTKLIYNSFYSWSLLTSLTIHETKIREWALSMYACRRKNVHESNYIIKYMQHSISCSCFSHYAHCNYYILPKVKKENPSDFSAKNLCRNMYIHWIKTTELGGQTLGMYAQ